MLKTKELINFLIFLYRNYNKKKSLIKKYKYNYAIHDSLEKNDSTYYIISYPKSGRTWLRYMLGNYLVKYYNIDVKNLLEIYDLTKEINIPKIAISHSGTGDGGYISSISEIQKCMDFYKDKNIILLKRDPRDVVVSSYHQNTSRKKIYWSNISNFIRSKIFGIKKIIMFNNLFLDNKKLFKSFNSISYEDFKDDTYSNFLSLLKILNIPINTKLITDVIEMSNFSTMKKNEVEGNYQHSQLRRRGDDENSLKVRKGKIGSYKEELSEKDIEYVNMIFNENNK